MMTIAISSCDDETNTLGGSVTDVVDKFMTVSQSYNIESKSIQSDAVLATSLYRYLGKIKDPETNSYISCDYMTQFSLLEEEATHHFPAKDIIKGRDSSDEPIADSCAIKIYVESYQGDSLTVMKVNVRELTEPIKSHDMYYSDFDPDEMGFVREADGAINQDKLYTISDLTVSDSLRNVYSKGGYYFTITIPLNKTYKDKDGKEYNNYGTYLMRKYYEDPSAFKNSNTFVNKVCPGFYFKSSDGQGLMNEVKFSQICVYYHYDNNGKEISTNTLFTSTQEVLRTTHITNDPERIERLVNIDTCTYLKTPAGIFTEVTLPIEEIKLRKDKNGISHENDTITSAKIVFNRMRNTSDLSDILLEEPVHLLLIERDSLYSFFENNEAPDNEKSFLATYNSTQKTYSFNNISNLVNRMWANRDKSKNWNKGILIPVQTSTTTTSTTTTTVGTLSNEMSITSVRLVGGDRNRHLPVRMSVIYNRNQ